MHVYEVSIISSYILVNYMVWATTKESFKLLGWVDLETQR